MLLTILLIASCKKEQEIILSKYGNGQIHKKISYELPITKDSVGIKTMFFENGKLNCMGEYRNGQRHGKWICYNRNGAIKWDTNYNSGKEDGEVYCKYENGTWKKLTSENGVKIGKTIEYNYDSTNNHFYYIYGQYENDLETGIWIWKDTNQQIIKEINYERGVNVGYFAFYYPNGNVKMKGYGFKREDEDFIVMKDTLFHYNEIENGTIDSLEIFKEGRLQKTIKKEY